MRKTTLTTKPTWDGCGATGSGQGSRSSSQQRRCVREQAQSTSTSCQFVLHLFDCSFYARGGVVQALKVDITVHQHELPTYRIECGRKGARAIRISYHDGEHYNSVRALGRDSKAGGGGSGGGGSAGDDSLRTEAFSYTQVTGPNPKERHLYDDVTRRLAPGHLVGTWRPLGGRAPA